MSWIFNMCPGLPLFISLSPGTSSKSGEWRWHHSSSMWSNTVSIDLRNLPGSFSASFITDLEKSSFSLGVDSGGGGGGGGRASYNLICPWSACVSNSLIMFLSQLLTILTIHMTICHKLLWTSQCALYEMCVCVCVCVCDFAQSYRANSKQRMT